MGFRLGFSGLDRRMAGAERESVEGSAVLRSDFVAPMRQPAHQGPHLARHSEWHGDQKGLWLFAAMRIAVVLHVVLPTEPTYFQRFCIVLVVSIDLLESTDFAGLLGELPTRHG